MLFNPPNDSAPPRHNKGNLAAGVVIGSQPVNRAVANDDGSSAIVSNRFQGRISAETPGGVGILENRLCGRFVEEQETFFFFYPPYVMPPRVCKTHRSARFLCALPVCVCVYHSLHHSRGSDSMLISLQPQQGIPTHKPKAIYIQHLTSCHVLPLPVPSQRQLDPPSPPNPRQKNLPRSWGNMHI